jgi:acetate kinase
VGFKTVLAKGYYGIHELTPPVLRAMEETLPLAPAHNGFYLVAIRTMREALPGTVFVGAFETAFHQTVPLERALYGVPYSWHSRYGNPPPGLSRSLAQLCGRRAERERETRIARFPVIWAAAALCAPSGMAAVLTHPLECRCSRDSSSRTGRGIWTGPSCPI